MQVLVISGSTRSEYRHDVNCRRSILGGPITLSLTISTFRRGSLIAEANCSCAV